MRRAAARLDAIVTRYTEAGLYTLRDTPMFTCAKSDIASILSQVANLG